MLNYNEIASHEEKTIGDSDEVIVHWWTDDLFDENSVSGYNENESVKEEFITL